MQKVKNKSFSLYVNEEMKNFLTSKANEKGITRNTLITN